MLLLPPSRARLAVGLAVGVLGPIAVTPLVTLPRFHVFPSLPYLLCVVAATLLARLSGGLVAVAVSLPLLDYYAVPPLHHLGLPTTAELIPLAAFVAVSVVVAELLALQDRARMSAERAVSEARRAEEHLAFLSEVSELLSQSLDYAETFSRLAELVVRDMTDLCLIDVITEEGSIERVAAVHADPALQPLADRLRRDYVPMATGPHPVARVIRSGKPEFSAVMPEDYLRSTTRDQEHFRIVTEMGFQSFMCVPLLARDRILGTVTFVSTNPARRYHREDVELAMEVGRRAAVRIDNVRLYQAEQDARAAAEAARERLAALAGASRVLATSLDYGETLTRAVQLGVRWLGEYGVVYVPNDRGDLESVAAAHRDPELQTVLQQHLRLLKVSPRDGGIVAHAARTRAPVVLDETVDATGQVIPGLEGLPRADDLRPRSAMAMPMIILDRTTGVLALVSTGQERRYGAEEIEFGQELARRMARAIENARLFSDRDRIAHTLQQALLPPGLPEIPGVELAAAYRAGGRGQEVGGDFYDAFETTDGGWAMVIGDVCGKGPEAAAVSGLARHTVRALVLRERRPRAVLAALNTALLRESDDLRFCTACYVRVMPTEAGMAVNVSCGGHPPPVIVRASGALETVGPNGTLLGAFPDPELADEEAMLAPGDSLILYTDGLLGKRSAEEVTREDGLGPLFRSVAGVTASEAAEMLVPRALGRPPESDDVAVMVARILPPETDQIIG